MPAPRAVRQDDTELDAARPPRSASRPHLTVHHGPPLAERLAPPTTPPTLRDHLTDVSDVVLDAALAATALLRRGAVRAGHLGLYALAAGVRSYYFATDLLAAAWDRARLPPLQLRTVLAVHLIGAPAALVAIIVCGLALGTVPDALMAVPKVLVATGIITALVAALHRLPLTERTDGQAY